MPPAQEKNQRPLRPMKLPALPPQIAHDTLLDRYATALFQAGYQGEVDFSHATRLTAATDNSIYQLLPGAVLFPRTREDVSLALRTGTAPEFASLSYTARGGGTGTNGQALSTGVILDCSRHLNRILELNLDEGWVRVEPGVILDQLNDYLKPHGVFFAPSLSPSNRATLGGMISTDACGKGSRVYGRTSNHVRELVCVLQDGGELVAQEIGFNELKTLRRQEGHEGRIYSTVDDIVSLKRRLIETQFPKMDRFLTGYNLAHAKNWEAQTFSLCPIIAGSEGSLCVVVEATLKLTPLPKARELVLLRYRDWQSALDHAAVLLESSPSAIETIDDKILDLARGDEVYHCTAHLLQDPAMRAVNLIEFTGEVPEVAERLASLKQQCADTSAAANDDSGLLGFHVAMPSEITALWELRKRGVGLLANSKGARKPIPFIEDTAVPPEHLGAYIREFQALLESHGLEYAMFGHVDVGCIHVRPRMNMQDEGDASRIRELSDRVVALVRKYGGVLWAEHGKGFRSEYVPLFFGEELYADLRRIKEAFDPYNRMNPGKVVTPLSLPDATLRVEGPFRGQQDREIELGLQNAFEEAISCDGNGQCFHYHADYVMCPSMKVTSDRVHSPKGRAALLREWMRLLSQHGFSEGNPAGFMGKTAWGWRKGYPHKHAKREELESQDFSHTVYRAMAGCLACKACTSQCPVHVDIPEFRARFLNLYHSRYRRPLRDYLVARVEKTAALQARFPALANLMMLNPLSRALVDRFLGFVDPPALSSGRKRRQYRRLKVPLFAGKPMDAAQAASDRGPVLLYQDAFNLFYDVEVLTAAVRLLRALGYRVWRLPYHPSGKPMHLKGFLKEYRDLAIQNRIYLEWVSSQGAPIVGLEPSVTLSLRDEHAKALGFETLPYKVSQLQEWLVSELKGAPQLAQDSKSEPWYLLGHCTERTALPGSGSDWKRIFAHLGQHLVALDTGCCGMAGTYGHEKEHQDESRRLYDLSWAPKIREHKGRVVATGYSCRSQVKRFEGMRIPHPVEVLAESLG